VMQFHYLMEPVFDFLGMRFWLFTEILYSK
jgi:hypothetical protein